MLEPPKSLLEERRLKGADRWDEVWEGILHMVPPPSRWHQEFGSELLALLRPLAKAKGLHSSYETGVFRPGTGERDYRVPDFAVYKSEHASERGIEGRAELVIEILSEDDESREKLPFYSELGIPEVILIEPATREIELYVLRGKQLYSVLPDDRGAVVSRILGVTFQRVEGPRLRLLWSGGQAEI